MDGHLTKMKVIPVLLSLFWRNFRFMFNLIFYCLGYSINWEKWNCI